MFWKFPAVGIGDIERQSHDREFFIQESLDHAALIREAIQNSLDAGISQEKPVKIRFFLGTIEKKDYQRFFDNFSPHFKASFPEKNLLPAKDLPFLVLEDFNTRGLDGEYEPDRNGESNFLDFWWGEGISHKGGKRGGRWGLGKAVFHSASKLNSFFGYTVRKSDGEKLLLGKASLKPHRINDIRYKYHGHFVSDENFRPIKDENTIKEFCNCFGLSRQDDSPGLSLVVPAYQEGYSKDNLLKAIITEYFFPIIKKKLVCVVEDDQGRYEVDDETLIDLARQQDWSDTDWDDQGIDSLMGFILEVATRPHREWIELNVSTGQQSISEDLFGENLERARDLFENEELLMIKIPIKIEKKEENPKASYFEVYLQKDASLKRGREYYIRSGILVPGIRKLTGRRVRGLLYADDELISEFLGDAETPAHYDWNENSEGFKDKYEKPSWTLRFIKNSLKNIVEILERPPEGEDKDFLKEIFFVEGQGELEDRGQEQGDSEDHSGGREDIPEIPSGKKEFNVKNLKNGLKIENHEGKINSGDNIKIRIAYDVRKGNPFSRYQPFDFRLEDSNSIAKLIKGAKEINCSGNELELEITDPGFSIILRGFDENRDVVIDIRRAAR